MSEQGRNLVFVNPFRCRMWRLHERLDDHITETDCRLEIESFTQHGQLVPVLGRRIDHPDYDVELIYGARRLFVAQHANVQLMVELRELSDRDAIVAMDIENRQRKDLSPYERGLSYSRWLRAGHFRSQGEIARALNISVSQVSRLLKFARLPSIVVDAFGRASDICEGWGLELAEALEEPRQRRAAIEKARAIAAISPRPPAQEVYRQLLASSAPGRKPRPGSHDAIVRGCDGVPLFRVRHQRNTIALILPIQKVSAAVLQNIESAVSEILQDSGSDDAAKVSRTDLPRERVGRYVKPRAANDDLQHATT